MAKDKVITLGPNELPNLYIRTTLKGCKKLSHIEGNSPPRDYPKFEAWDDEDSLIMTWLWNSMTSKISRNYMFYSSVHEIWENLNETYSMKKDSAACYDRQGTLSVTEYYRTLNGLWIELDQYQGLKMCKAYSIAYTRLVERERIFKFLHDLNFEYDPIRVQIQGKEKLPSLFEVFFIVRSEETQRLVMLDKGNSNIGPTMVTRKGPTKRSTSKGKPFTKNSRGEYYTYCKQSGHTKGTGYKRYGKEKVFERMSGK
ncbi:hypothetical protein CR513_01455, partial [Mucuna pruriens]